MMSKRDLVTTEWLEEVVQNTVNKELNEILDTILDIEKALNSPTNNHKPWSEREDYKLAAEVDVFVTVVAKNHGRSINTIIARLKKNKYFQ
ncbi:MAG: hypothetical protein GY841_14150 [FCB group bacterium]|nr:hypothetical protein [FCB group bacterium]